MMIFTIYVKIRALSAFMFFFVQEVYVCFHVTNAPIVCKYGDQFQASTYGSEGHLDLEETAPSNGIAHWKQEHLYDGHYRAFRDQAPVFLDTVLWRKQ